VEECGHYIRELDKIVHVQNRRRDGTSGGLAHGDRVIAAMVAVQVAKKYGMLKTKVAKEQKLSDKPPPNTMAARMKALEDAKVLATDDWDARTNWALAHGSERTGSWRD
jgi:hypothetical protein